MNFLKLKTLICQYPDQERERYQHPQKLSWCRLPVTRAAAIPLSEQIWAEPQTYPECAAPSTTAGQPVGSGARRLHQLACKGNISPKPPVWPLVASPRFVTMSGSQGTYVRLSFSSGEEDAGNSVVLSWITPRSLRVTFSSGFKLLRTKLTAAVPKLAKKFYKFYQSSCIWLWVGCFLGESAPSRSREKENVRFSPLKQKKTSLRARA